MHKAYCIAKEIFHNSLKGKRIWKKKESEKKKKYIYIYICSLVVQWLGFGAAVSLGSIPDQGTKILQATAQPKKNTREVIYINGSLWYTPETSTTL